MPAIKTDTPNLKADGGDAMEVAKDVGGVLIARVAMRRKQAFKPYKLLKLAALDYAFEIYEHGERDASGTYKAGGKSRLSFTLSQLLPTTSDDNTKNAVNVVNKVLYLTAGTQLINYAMKGGDSWGVTLSDYLVGLGIREIGRNYGV